MSEEWDKTPQQQIGQDPSATAIPTQYPRVQVQYASPSQQVVAAPAPPRPVPRHIFNPCGCCCCPSCNLRANCIAIGIICLVWGLLQYADSKQVKTDSLCGEDAACKLNTSIWRLMMYILCTLLVVAGILAIVAAAIRSANAAKGSSGIFFAVGIYHSIYCIFALVHCELVTQSYTADDTSDNIKTACFVGYGLRLVVWGLLLIYFGVCMLALGRQISAGVDLLPVGGAQGGPGDLAVPPPPAYTQSQQQLAYYPAAPNPNQYNAPGSYNYAPQQQQQPYYGSQKPV